MMKKTTKHTEAEVHTWKANGKKFLVRTLADKFGTNHFVGEMALSNELLNNPTNEVMHLDDEIIYYEPKEILIKLSDKELADLLYKGSGMILEEFNFNDDENIA